MTKNEDHQDKELNRHVKLWKRWRLRLTNQRRGEGYEHYGSSERIFRACVPARLGGQPTRSMIMVLLIAQNAGRTATGYEQEQHHCGFPKEDKKKRNLMLGDKNRRVGASLGAPVENNRADISKSMPTLKVKINCWSQARRKPPGPLLSIK